MECIHLTKLRRVSQEGWRRRSRRQCWKLSATAFRAFVGMRSNVGTVVVRICCKVGPVRGSGASSPVVDGPMAAARGVRAEEDAVAIVGVAGFSIVYVAGLSCGGKMWIPVGAEHKSGTEFGFRLSSWQRE